MKSKGQNLVEFAIIIALVVICGIVVLTMLGSNVNEMFSKSYSASKKYKPFDWNNNSSVTGKTQNQNNNSGSGNNDDGSADTLIIDGIEVQQNKDGSVSFNAGDQVITLSSEIIGLQDTVTESVGSGGLESLIPEIANFVNKHKAEYEPEDVPLQISFGMGDRNMTNVSYGLTFLGNASINSVAIKAGDDLLVLQNDQDIKNGMFLLASGQQSCDGTVTGCDQEFKDLQGLYRLEGKVDSNGHFAGEYVNKSDTTISGSYSAAIDDSSGFVLNNSTYTSTVTPENYIPSTWNLDFSDSNLTFDLSQ